MFSSVKRFLKKCLFSYHSSIKVVFVESSGLFTEQFYPVSHSLSTNSVTSESDWLHQTFIQDIIRLKEPEYFFFFFFYNCRTLYRFLSTSQSCGTFHWFITWDPNIMQLTMVAFWQNGNREKEKKINNFVSHCTCLERVPVLSHWAGDVMFKKLAISHLQKKRTYM